MANHIKTSQPKDEATFFNASYIENEVRMVKMNETLNVVIGIPTKS